MVTKEEWECPECGFIPIPEKGEVSDPSFKPEEGYVYAEYCCPTCETIILITRRRVSN